MTEDGAMPRTLLALVPQLADAKPDLTAELDAVRAYADDLEWRVDFLEAELAAEHEQRRELELELGSVRRLVELGVIDPDRRAHTADVPASGGRRVEDERRDTPPPPTTT